MKTNSPPTAESPDSCESAKWRDAIGGLWKWSEAVPLLEEFYSLRGTGAAALHCELSWSDGRFSKRKTSSRRPIEGRYLSIHKVHSEALLKALRCHLAGKRAPHVMLYGQQGMGKSWLLTSVMQTLSSEKRLRVVTLLRPELKSLHSLLDEIAEHPKLRFAIVIDDLAFRSGDDTGLLTLKRSLEGSHKPWPENALLLVTTPSANFCRTKSPSGQDWTSMLGAEAALYFGLILRFDNMSSEEFLDTMRELATSKEVDMFDDINLQQNISSWLEARASHTDLEQRTVVGAKMCLQSLASFK